MKALTSCALFTSCLLPNIKAKESSYNAENFLLAVMEEVVKILIDDEKKFSISL